MELQTLIERYSGSREDRGKAVFSTIFIVGNKLQTLFDARIPKLTLRQFMLLSIAGQRCIAIDAHGVGGGAGLLTAECAQAGRGAGS